MSQNLIPPFSYSMPGAGCPTPNWKLDPSFLSAFAAFCLFFFMRLYPYGEPSAANCSVTKGELSAVSHPYEPKGT